MLSNINRYILNDNFFKQILIKMLLSIINKYSLADLKTDLKKNLWLSSNLRIWGCLPNLIFLKQLLIKMLLYNINRYSLTDLKNDFKNLDVVFQPENFRSSSKFPFFKQHLIKMPYNINRYGQADLKMIQKKLRLPSNLNFWNK